MLSRERIISELQVDPVKWLKPLSKSLDAVLVKSANLVDNSVTNSISAKVNLEGVEDVRDAIPKLIGSRKYTVFKLRLEARVNGDATKIDILADGRANTSLHLEKLRPILRETLIETRALQRKS